MTRTREELADELERRVGFLRELRDGTGHEGKATLATQMAHAADVGWAVEQNLRTILAALREPPEPTAEEVERAAGMIRRRICDDHCRVTDGPACPCWATAAEILRAARSRP